jgi:hypothetical protein
MALCRSQEAQPGPQRLERRRAVRRARLTPHHMAAVRGQRLRAQATRGARLSAASESVPRRGVHGPFLGARTKLHRTTRVRLTAWCGRSRSFRHARERAGPAPPRDGAEELHATTKSNKAPLAGWARRASDSQPRARRRSCLLPHVLPWNSEPSWRNLRPPHRSMQPTAYSLQGSASTSDVSAFLRCAWHLVVVFSSLLHPTTHWHNFNPGWQHLVLSGSRLSHSLPQRDVLLTLLDNHQTKSIGLFV